jgi:hypothetical protein
MRRILGSVLVVLLLLLGRSSWAGDEDGDEVAQPPAGEEAKPEEVKPPEEPKPTAEPASEAKPGDEPATEAPPVAAPVSAPATEAAEHPADDHAAEGPPLPEAFQEVDDAKLDDEEETTDEELERMFSDDVLTDEEDAALAAAEGNPGLFAQLLRAQLLKVKKIVLAKIETKLERKQKKTLGRVSMFLIATSFAGFFLLLTPLFLRRKYPGKGMLLFKYGALAAVVFFVALNLFAGTLVVLRMSQNAMSKVSNPQIAVVSSAIDSLYDSADEIAELGTISSDVIKATLDQLQNGDTDEPLPVAMIDNVANVLKDAQGPYKAFKAVKGFFQQLNVVMGYLPIALALLAVVLFLVGIKPTLTEIIGMPARAAAGGGSVGKETTKRVMSAVLGQLLATACLILVLGVVIQLSGLLLSLAVRPAVDVFLEYLIACALYVQGVPGATGTPIFLSLAGCVFFLVLNIAFIIMASTFFIGKAQKIFRERFVDKVPLKVHKRFWLWGTIGMVLCLALPYLIVLGGAALVDGPITNMFIGGEDPTKHNWSGYFIGGPLLLVVGFLVAYWALRGFKAIGFLLKYKPKAVAEAAGYKPTA